MTLEDLQKQIKEKQDNLLRDVEPSRIRRSDEGDKQGNKVKFERFETNPGPPAFSSLPQPEDSSSEQAHNYVAVAGAINGVPATLNVDTDGTGWT